MAAVFSHYATEPALKALRSADVLYKSAAMLIINDLSLRMAGRLLLDHASLTLPAGTKAGLVGHNGTGCRLHRLICG